MKKTFKVAGMTCSACQAHVEKALRGVNGVKNAGVNLLKNIAVIEYDEKICQESTLLDSVKKAGYALLPLTGENTKQKDKDLQKLIASIILLLALMYFSMGNMMWGFPAPSIFDHAKSTVGFALLQLILTIPVLFIYRRFFI